MRHVIQSCFRLAYFERTNILVTQSQLLADAQDHYVSQAVKQAYVFILGLDVLGNPYGLFRDVKEGISDFFYEPYLVRAARDCENVWNLWEGELFEQITAKLWLREVLWWIFLSRLSRILWYKIRRCDILICIS